MANTPFHEHKLWQDAYVALMDVHEAFDGQKDGDNEEIAEQVLDSATDVTAKIADGLSRLDRRFGRQILMDAIGLVAVVRTHLAVAWGRGLVDDELFRALDGKYDTLGIALQNIR
jgi:four helix bundle protein